MFMVASGHQSSWGKFGPLLKEGGGNSRRKRMLVCRYMATRSRVSDLICSIWLLAAWISPLILVPIRKSLLRTALRFRSRDVSDLWNRSSFSSGSWAEYEAARTPQQTRLVSANRAQGSLT